MLPEQLWRVIRRSWALAVVIVVVCVVGFVGLAAAPARPYHASERLYVGLTKGSTQNTAYLQYTALAVQSQLESPQLKKAVQADNATLAGSFTTSVALEPNSGLLDVSVSSLSADLVLPVLTSYATEIGKTPPGQQYTVQISQLPGNVVQDSLAKIGIIAGIEGLVVGLALALAAALLLARFRQSRNLIGRLEERTGLTTLVTLPDPTEPGAGREDEFVLLAADIRASVVNRTASSFAVVSPRGSNTRSVVAAQLARGLAIAGHRVLLVDADLRAPRLESALAAINASPTMSFTGMSWLPTEATPVPNLVVLRGSSLQTVVEHLGMQGTGPVRLVAGSIASLVGEARNAGVILVVDTPAVEGAAEANAIISGVDAAVLVTSGPLRRRDVDRLVSLNTLAGQLGTQVLGLVAGPKKDFSLRPTTARVPV